MLLKVSRVFLDFVINKYSEMYSKRNIHIKINSVMFGFSLVSGELLCPQLWSNNFPIIP